MLKMENQFKNNDNVLLITNRDLVFEKTFIDDIIERVGEQNIRSVSVEELNKLSLNELSFDTILSNVQQIDDKILTLLLSLLKPNSKLIIKKSKDCTSAQVLSSLKLNGFVAISETIDEIVAQKPNYAIGSSVKLKQTIDHKSTAAKVWSLAAEDILDETVELINDEELLTDEDRAKPNAQSLKVCKTTKQRKACADCSCGLAQELENEAIDNIRKNTQNAKSSCGSCYLGDAFRCASCPYLGMPAFKPGQKVQLDLSNDDI